MNDILTKEEQAQQAETIAEIKKRHEIDCHWIAIYGSSQLLSDLGVVLQIVDSQAQKIAEQAEEIDNLSKRGVKKYSEEDLYEEIRKNHSDRWHGHDADLFQKGFISCARFLGALEEK